MDQKLNDSSTNNVLDIFIDKGLSGLSNLGNTCYMNTVIHCLSNTSPFTLYFLTNNYQHDINQDKVESHVVREWYRLMKGIWENNCTISPLSFQKVSITLANKCDVNFGNNQNDIHEFLVFLLDKLHIGLSRNVRVKISGKPKTTLDQMALEAYRQWREYFSKSYSIVTELFYGQSISSINSLVDSEISVTYQPYCYLSLPIPRKKGLITLDDCLQEYFKKEILDNDNPWYSEKDKCHKKASKQLLLWSTPTILIITLKRFNQHNLQKIDAPVKFPINLDLENYCVGYDKPSSKYRLYSVANHFGNPMFGHYFAYCFNRNGNWYQFDDHHVTRINEDQIETNQAYCLFYQKIKD